MVPEESVPHNQVSTVLSGVLTRNLFSWWFSGELNFGISRVFDHLRKLVLAKIIAELLIYEIV